MRSRRAYCSSSGCVSSKRPMAAFSQFDSLGRLRHLTTLEGVEGETIRGLLEHAQRFLRSPGEIPVHARSLEGITVGNVFTEPSTRTRSSFELAARRLGADVLNLEIMLSSRMKGESVLDTIYTLQ